MNTSKTRCILAVLMTFFASLAFSQAPGAYPTRPIRWVVPFAPGSSDVLARTLGNKATETIGQPFVIDTRPGAGGNIGTAAVAQAAPDGYTILLGTIATHGVNPSLYRSLPYDAIKDFSPVALLALAPNVLVVNPSLPAKSVKEFIQHARNQPGITYGSAGPGTSMHMAGELFQSLAGVKMTHVPYKGTAQAVLAVARGEIHAMFSNLPPALGMIQDGRVRALAVTTPTRVSWLPDLPTVAEGGLPGYDVSVWFGAFAPAGTTPAVVNRLAKELRAAATEPETEAKLQAQGYIVQTMEPAEFAAFVKQEVARWMKVVRETGAKVN